MTDVEGQARAHNVMEMAEIINKVLLVLVVVIGYAKAIDIVWGFFH